MSFLIARRRLRRASKGQKFRGTLSSRSKVHMRSLGRLQPYWCTAFCSKERNLGWEAGACSHWEDLDRANACHKIRKVQFLLEKYGLRLLGNLHKASSTIHKRPSCFVISHSFTQLELTLAMPSKNYNLASQPTIRRHVIHGLHGERLDVEPLYLFWLLVTMPIARASCDDI